MKDARFAYLLKKFPRLSETFVLGELLGQEALGRPLHVFSRRAPDDEPRHPELARLGARVEVLPPVREIDPWSALFGDGEEALDGEVFAGLGDVVRAARAWDHPRFPALVAEALHLLRRTRALGIRHLHTHFATDSALVAYIVSRLGGPSFSVTAHAKDIYRRAVKPAVLQDLCDQAAFLVTVCDANVRWIEEELGVRAPGKLRRLYNGIDLGAFPFVEEGRDPREILSVGRLVEKKGFFVLLEALAVLRARGVDFHATLCGDGEERERIERTVGELGLGDRVRLTGAVDQDGIRTALRRAGVFCLPCLVGDDGNRDALPTVLLEALASGLPCVSTPVTGIPEILDGGRAGRLVAERDAAATADALEELLGAPAERARLARAGRARAEALFDREASARTLGGWFDEVVRAEAVPCG